jgi:hypothetical protein
MRRSIERSTFRRDRDCLSSLSGSADLAVPAVRRSGGKFSIGLPNTSQTIFRALQSG